MRNVAFVVGVLSVVLPGPASAEDTAESAPGEQEAAEYDTVVVATGSRESIVRDHRAVSVVTAEDIEEMAPRTTPEALHFAPGVSVQKTNHAGGSPFIRGRTGQETLVLLDGFRLNTSIMRSGPNQYLNTIDPLTLGRIEVLRGAGSVLYGSDAIGGVVSLRTKQPAGKGPVASVFSRAASAERSGTGRLELDAGIGRVGILAGMGARKFGDLRGGGPIATAEEPVYDGDVQRFTGYEEASGDVRATVDLGKRGRITTAALLFRQFDAPRTDRCSVQPTDCRFFEEQFYDIGYVRYSGRVRGALEEIEAGIAVARTHERRRRVREARDLVQHELDEVLTVGLTGRASTPTWRFGDAGRLRVSYGAELYVDALSSEAENEVLSTGERMEQVRGKYLDGSGYASTAGFGFAELALSQDLSFTGGVRGNAVRARVASDPESRTRGFTQTELVPIGSVGVRLRLADGVHVVGNLDQGFRTPNLDDLTARSSEGPGFQIANPDLDAQSSVTLEAGVVLEGPVLRLSAYAYQSFIDEFIARESTDCPPELDAQCGDEENVFVLTNADSARIHGIESAMSVSLPAAVTIRAVVGWTVGTQVFPNDPNIPLSKIPPLSGRVAVRYRLPHRAFVETVATWAAAQDRLSPADEADRRIPPNGTEAYGVVDLRAGARLGTSVQGTITLENIADARYRVHGSGVDGAGFGVIASVRGTLGRP